MIESTVTKIKNGTITLPKELRKQWPAGEVIFMRSPGGFTVKSITPPSLTALAKRLSQGAKKARVTAKDVDSAAVWAKKKLYAGRA